MVLWRPADAKARHIAPPLMVKCSADAHCPRSLLLWPPARALNQQRSASGHCQRRCPFSYVPTMYRRAAARFVSLATHMPQRLLRSASRN